MGASTKTLLRLVSLRRAGLLGPGSRMVELGAQNLHCGGGKADLATFVSDFTGKPCRLDDATLSALASGGPMSQVMRHVGIDYLALDIFEYESTMLFDLNTDSVSEEMRGAYDLVTNFGTTEHIIGQHNAMKVMHDLAKPSGLIYHDLPMGGYFYHGYFSYNPLFFHHLASSNEYEIVFRHFSKVPAHTPYGTSAGPELRENGWPDEGYHDVGIEYIFKKSSARAFRVPIEVGTSHSFDRDFLLSRTPDIAIISGMNT